MFNLIKDEYYEGASSVNFSLINLLTWSTLKMLMFLATLLAFIISRSSSRVTSLLPWMTER